MNLDMILFYVIELLLLYSQQEQLNFLSSLVQSKLSVLKKWLIYAVSLAEKELGSGTGALKLRRVYDNFAVKFPTLVEFISFEKSSNYVDEALISMRKMLECNKDVSVYINGDKSD